MGREVKKRVVSPTALNGRILVVCNVPTSTAANRQMAQEICCETRSSAAWVFQERQHEMWIF